MLYKSISWPPKCIFLLCYLLLKKVMENISFNVFWIFKLHDIKKWHSTSKKHLKFLSQHFEETEKEKLFPNDSSFLKNLKNARQILSWQSKFSKFLQTYLLTSSNAPHFSTKKESVMILKMTNFWWKNIFHDARK